MPDGTRITAVAAVPENGSFLFSVQEADGRREEVILLRLADGVAAYKNFCQHETDQRLDRGFGAAVRGETVVCPRHGSRFDVATGYCDNGKAAGETLVEVDVTVEDGQVYLTDDAATYLWEGGLDDDQDDEGPDATSHLRF